MKSENIKTIQEIEEFEGFTARDKKGVWIYKLDCDYIYQTGIKTDYFNSKWLEILSDGTIRVKKGYAWDGCSIKWNILDLAVIGTPDGVINIETMKPKAYYASLVHDALYQYMGYHSITRKGADKIFLRILRENKFIPAKIYYYAVRIFGGIGFINKKMPEKKGNFEKIKQEQ